MELTLQNFALLVASGSCVLSAVFAALMWRMRGEFATKRELAEESKVRMAIGNDVGALAGRVNTVETQLKSVPTKDEMAEIRVLLEEVRGDQKAIVESVDGLAEAEGRTAAAVGRIEGFFLETAIKQGAG